MTHVDGDNVNWTWKHDRLAIDRPASKVVSASRDISFSCVVYAVELHNIMNYCPRTLYHQSIYRGTPLYILTLRNSFFKMTRTINLLCWCPSVYMIWHQNIWRERVFSCPPYLVDHTSVSLRTTNFSYRDRWLFPWALGRSARRALPRGTLFQLGYGTHLWHSNSSSVCSRRHCLRDCHRTRLSDSSLLFVRFEVSVYYYYYYYYYYCRPMAYSLRQTYLIGLLWFRYARKLQSFSVCYTKIYVVSGETAVICR